MHRHDSPQTLAELVVARMTLSEKLGEIVLLESPPYENFNAGDRRLCIPSLVLQDGPQGVAFGASHVTQLPAPLAIGATFNRSIAQEYGQVIGSEASGKGINVIQGPNLNVVRVPESGRNFESFGEDPLLVSTMGVAGIEGIQSTGVMAMAKHFAAYSQETNRGELDDIVSKRTLEEIYLPPFEAAVTQAHVSAVLCAYPELNGTLQCQDNGLLGQLRRWGFTGFVRSDLGSVDNPVAALEAGTDLLKPEQTRQLASLVDEGQLPVAVVNAAVVQVLTSMFAHHLIGRAPRGRPRPGSTPAPTPRSRSFPLSAPLCSSRTRDRCCPCRVPIRGSSRSSVPLPARLRRQQGSAAPRSPLRSSPHRCERSEGGRDRVQRSATRTGEARPTGSPRSLPLR